MKRQKDSSGRGPAGRLRAELAGEKEKILGLPRKQRLPYILQYYWLWILGIACAVFLLCYVPYRAFFTVKDYWFYGMFANTSADAGNGSALWQDFTAFGGYDTSRKKVEMNDSSWFDPSKTGGTNNTYFQAFVAMAESGTLDVLTMEKEGLTETGRSGRLLDLDRPEAAAVKARWGDRFVYCEPYDEEYGGAMVPVGIDVSDSLLMTKYHLYEESCVLGIGAQTKRMDAVVTFLAFILEEEIP